MCSKNMMAFHMLLKSEPSINSASISFANTKYVKTNRIIIIAITSIAISLLTLGTAIAETIIVEPDNSTIGTDIRFVTPGVTLSVNGAPNVEVRSVDGHSPFNGKNIASTGLLVFGRFPLASQIVPQGWSESIGLLRADFLYDASQVEIDLIFDDDDIGLLWAYNKNGVLLATASGRGDGRTSTPKATVRVTRSQADIAYILAGGVEAEGLFLDNLRIQSSGPLNVAPIANAGNDQLIKIGQTVSLNGNSSVDPDGNNPLAYSWTFVTRPTNSTASLINANTASASFVADKAGSYLVQLLVTDALGVVSSPDTVSISTESIFIVIEPDNFAENASMREPATGIHISVHSKLSSDVRSINGYSSFNNRNLATTGTRVFAQYPSPSSTVPLGWNESIGLLRADFDFPVDFVQIDLILTMTILVRSGHLIEREIYFSSSPRWATAAVLYLGLERVLHVPSPTLHTYSREALVKKDMS